MGLSDADVVFALVVPGDVAGRGMERGAEDHILDGEGGDDGVVRLEHSAADNEGLGIEDAGSETNLVDVEVGVEDGDDFVFAFAIEVGEGDP